MNRKQEDKKLLIIQAGLKALYRKGYNATGVKEITDAAGIPKGSFYNYFSSKEDFAIAAMHYFTERELVVMQEILTDKEFTPLQRIVNLYRFKIDHFINRGKFSFGCFLCNITLEMADVSDVIAKEATIAFEREDQPLIDCLKEAEETGEISFEKDIQQTADLLRNSWLGALVIMKANKDKQPLESFLQTLQQVILK